MGNRTDPLKRVREQALGLENLVSSFDDVPVNYMQQSATLRILLTGSSGKSGLLEDLSGFQLPRLKRFIGDKVERNREGFFLPGTVETHNKEGGRLFENSTGWIDGILGINDSGAIVRYEKNAPSIPDINVDVDVYVSKIHDVFEQDNFTDLKAWLNQRFLRPESTIEQFIKWVANKDGGAHIEDEFPILLTSLQRWNRLQNCIICSISTMICERILSEADFGL